VRQASEEASPLVLVIDDDPDCRRDLGIAVEAMGYRSVTASDGASGLDRLRLGGIAAVITDWQMPGMDGVAVAGAVKANGGRLPVILVTGATHWRAGAKELRARGVDERLFKPVDIKRLRQCLAELIAK
jgi:DNA-binding NtrC family response regulator